MVVARTVHLGDVEIARIGLGTMGVIKEYRDPGAIRHTGMTHVTVEPIERVRRVVPLAAVQNPYSVVDRTYDDVVDHCLREGIVTCPERSRGRSRRAGRGR